MTPLANLQATLIADLQCIWDSLSKRAELQDRKLSDYFDLTFTALPRKVLVPDKFEAELQTQRKWFIDKGKEKYLFKSAYHKRIPTIVGGGVGQIYMKAQLCVKREMSNAKSLVPGHFGATVAGLILIRTYDAQSSFKAESLVRIDRYTRAARTFWTLNRWVSVRINALRGLFAGCLAAYII